MDAAAASTSSNLEKPPDDMVAKVWGQDEASAERASRGYDFFRDYGLRARLSILKNSWWQNFPRLEFGIWDLKRMVILQNVQHFLSRRL